MLEANYTQAKSLLSEQQHQDYVGNEKALGAKQPESKPILAALEKLEGEIKNLNCSIELLQRKLEPVVYFTSSNDPNLKPIGQSGCFVYEQIEERTFELYQMRQRLNSIIEALQI